MIGDADELTQVFLNLVDNAIKYGDADGAVRVEARRAEETQTAGWMAGQDGAVSVSVADRGDGIPREHLPRLTERFYRVDKARSRELGGTGLGLAIVKHIVNRHRGALSVDSTPGEGSTFTVHLQPALAPDDALSGGASQPQGATASEHADEPFGSSRHKIVNESDLSLIQPVLRVWQASARPGARCRGG